MRVTDFSFELPESLIAHYPMPERSSCRLLSLDGPTGALTHGTFTDLLDKLNPGDLLVFNNTRVIPARLFGRKASGGKIEVLVERMLDDKRILAHIRASKAPKPGAELLLGDDESINATMTARHGALFEVEFNDERSVLDILNSIGHMPLPPYIDRPDEDADRELYQTVYSEKPGAVAAPTAGLHFDEPLLEKLRAKGVEMAFVTLHVGAGCNRAGLSHQQQLRMFNQLDSHDTARFKTLLGRDIARLPLAVVWLFTWPGVPCIYYGDEVGLDGKNDPFCRKPFPWQVEKQDTALFALYQRMIALRKKSQALRHGGCQVLYAEDNVVVFVRVLNQQRVLVAINRGEACEVVLPASPFLNAVQWQCKEGHGQLTDGILALPAISATVWMN